MDRIQRLFQAQAQAQGGGGPAADAPVVDTAELVYISYMALLKMLKHGRAGVPMEVTVPVSLTDGQLTLDGEWGCRI